LLSLSGVPRGRLLDRFALQDVEQIVAEPVIEHDRGSAPEVREALGCATTSNRGRRHEANVMPPAIHKKPVPGLNLVEDAGEGAARLGSGDAPCAFLFV
jgi:hypothetical protein